MYKKNFLFFYYTILFFLILAFTYFESSKRDYTSIIDFDLTVIHNSLQVISGQYPDYRDHTAYSLFLTYGIFYKLFSFFDNNLIINISNLVKSDNPEISLQKFYLISRYINSLIIFIFIIFFNKVLIFFHIDKKYIIISNFFLLLSESIVRNFVILRADILAVCLFFIAFYFLLNFSKSYHIKNIFFFSISMVLSLLAKVQIIFLFYFVIIFFIFYEYIEKRDLNLIIVKKKLIFSKLLNYNFKYLLLSFIFCYFCFQFVINIFINSSSKIGYFDFFIFLIYFFSIFLILKFLFKNNKIFKNYFYIFFSLLLIFSLFTLFFFKVLNFLNILNVDFNILLSVVNPFYFLKSYSSFSNKNFSSYIVYEMIKVFFFDFKFNLIYSLFLFYICFHCIYEFLYNLKFNNYFFYIFKICLFIFALIAINNFRYNPLYEIYIFPLFIFMILIYIKIISKKFKFLFISLFTLFFVINFYNNLSEYKLSLYAPSNHNVICTNKKVRDFYFVWAKNFNENFFKKVCFNKNLLFR